jgi:hypothetical protein
VEEDHQDVRGKREGKHENMGDSVCIHKKAILKPNFKKCKKNKCNVG